MRVHVRYFAMLREAVELDGELIDVELPASGTVTVADVRQALVNRDKAHADAFARVRRIRAAVNGTMALDQTPVAENDEVAFFPPVTGG